MNYISNPNLGNYISNTTRSKQPETTDVPNSLFCHPLDNARQIAIDNILKNGHPPPPAQSVDKQEATSSLPSHQVNRKRKVSA